MTSALGFDDHFDEQWVLYDFISKKMMQIEIQRGFSERNIMCFLFWVIYGDHDDTWTCQPSIYGNATRAENGK